MWVKRMVAVALILFVLVVLLTLGAGLVKV
jgi:hypothetical protein